MIPISDDNPTRTTPYVTYTLIALNVLAFIVEFMLQRTRGDAYVIAGYGLVPTRIFADLPGEAFTVLTSMFMHGGIGHLASNMLFLWIFGDNVEDAMGKGRYVAFYLLCGIGAAAAQVLTNPASGAPMVGASGAIAGVLAAYLVLYPRAPITVFVFIFFIALPAWVVIGGWFGMQLLAAPGIGSGASESGVAVYAHIGGFLAGVLAIRPALLGRPRIFASQFTGFRNYARPPGFRERRPRPPSPWDSWR
jgi:membrane associated rhomboid family serine protease